MPEKEKIDRGRVRAQIAVQVLRDGKVCIFSPREVSAGLHRHLAALPIAVSPPVGAMFGRYPTDELIATVTYAEVAAEIGRFVNSLPEICYERDRKPPAAAP